MTWVLERLSYETYTSVPDLLADATKAGFREGALDYARRRLVADGRIDVKHRGGIAAKGHWAWRRNHPAAESIDDVLR